MTLDSLFFDIILSDMKMPGGSGIDLLDKLSSVRNQKKYVPRIVIMSGYSDIEKDEVLDKGAVDILYKPFKMSDFYQLLNRLI